MISRCTFNIGATKDVVRVVQQVRAVCGFMSTPHVVKAHERCPSRGRTSRRARSQAAERGEPEDEREGDATVGELAVAVLRADVEELGAPLALAQLLVSVR